MRIGVQLPEVEWEVPFPELVSMARTAEAVGFDSLWLGDHLLYELEVGDRGPWEVWTSLAAIAASTSTIEIGPLVASTSFHAPAMLAKQATTVDAISGGRLILGLGAGWNRREYDAFGFRVRPPCQSVRRGLHDRTHPPAGGIDRLPRRLVPRRSMRPASALTPERDRH